MATAAPPKDTTLSQNEQPSPPPKRGWVGRSLAGLERLSLWVERPLEWLVRDTRYNPLYHTGTIATFLLVVILITGVYLTLFYQFGYGASYRAVGLIEANLVGQIMRAVHRYASGIAVIFTLLHAWRMLFQDRFRGPRWLAWLSGVLMTLLLWVAGVTGYWLIWDERALLLNQLVVDGLRNSPLGVSLLLTYVVGGNVANDWIFVLVVITVHLGVSALIGLGYWYHLKRLTLPKMLPPTPWMLALTGLLVLSALLAPVGLLPPLSATSFPTEVPIDPLFLFFLPAAFEWAWPPLLLWGSVIGLTAVVGVLPWVLRGRKPTELAFVATPDCTGCTFCAEDCPYKAITMQPREDDSGHQLLAVIDPNLCVACGVCLGSCPTEAISVGASPTGVPWVGLTEQIAAATEPPIVILTCERHAQQARGQASNQPQTVLFAVRCVGSVPTHLIEQLVQAGAKEVVVVGCPADDCTSRLGNVWLEERLSRERKPKLHRAMQTAPIHTAWQSPGQLQAAAQTASHDSATATAYKPMPLQWPNFIPAIIFLGVVLAVQVIYNNIPYQPYAAPPAMLQITLTHRSSVPLAGFEHLSEADPTSTLPTRLRLWVDGQVMIDEMIQPGENGLTQALIQQRFEPGEHHLRLVLQDGPDAPEWVVLDAVVPLQAGEILPIDLIDTPTIGDPLRGEALYFERVLGINSGCIACHNLDASRPGVGPSFEGVATRAAMRVPGMSAADYLRQSILEPRAFTVPGYPENLMVSRYEELLSEQQINDLVAFLLTLE